MILGPATQDLTGRARDLGGAQARGHPVASSATVAALKGAPLGAALPDIRADQRNH